MSVYENPTYEVVVSGTNGYDVVNKRTGVIEGTIDHLPGAMMTADTYNEYLTKKDKESKTNEASVIPIR